MDAHTFLGHFEPSGRRTADGDTIYRPRELEGCGGCDAGPCCGVENGGTYADCCGQGEDGHCADKPIQQRTKASPRYHDIHEDGCIFDRDHGGGCRAN